MKSVLVALNAQYIHTNLAVRSIAAYIAEQGATPPEIAEFTINQHEDRVLQLLHQYQADVYLFSCYIWNIESIQRLTANLRKILPHAVLVVGGPEVSYRAEEILQKNPSISAVITGEGEEKCFRLLQIMQAGGDLTSCSGVITRNMHDEKMPNTQPAAFPDMDSLPFAYRDIEALTGRILYYESMRGCPFSCSYCLSSVEKGVRFKSLPRVFEDLKYMLSARPRQVKFVDRTFNCRKEHAMEIWRFLTENDNGITNFHFELAGEFLDEDMLSFLKGVRPGLFQFEIGVQSTNINTLKEIRRFENLEKLFNMVSSLLKTGNIHLHLDLIAGLPYEDFTSFSQSFNRVYEQHPHQLQLGFLKVLPGSEMQCKSDEYGLVYQSEAPYEVLHTNHIDYEEICVLKQIEHMVDLYYNNGRFTHIIDYLCSQYEDPFQFYTVLANTYAAGGHEDEPLSKMGHYTLLGMLAQSLGSEVENHAQWLCKYDLALHEKVKTLPSWLEEISHSMNDKANPAGDISDVTDGDSIPAEKAFSAGTSRISGTTNDLREEILAFYSDDENIRKYLPAYAEYQPKQIRRMTHLETFPFHPETGDERNCALLFDYQCRDLMGWALVQDVSFWFEK